MSLIWEIFLILTHVQLFRSQHDFYTIKEFRNDRSTQAYPGHFEECTARNILVMFRLCGIILVGLILTACYTIPIDKNTYVLEQYSSSDCIVMRTVKISEDGETKTAFERQVDN